MPNKATKVKDMCAYFITIGADSIFTGFMRELFEVDVAHKN